MRKRIRRLKDLPPDERRRLMQGAMEMARATPMSIEAALRLSLKLLNERVDHA